MWQATEQCADAKTVSYRSEIWVTGPKLGEILADGLVEYLVICHWMSLLLSLYGQQRRHLDRALSSNLTTLIQTRRR